MDEHSSMIDGEKMKAMVERVFGILGGAVNAGMIHLGDRLGLYRALAGAGPLTSEELARKTNLHERWVREWLEGQAVTGLVDHVGDRRFVLSNEGAMVLANEESPFFAAGGFSALPQQLAVLDRLPESFRTGVGLPYDVFGPEGAVGIER